MRYSDYQERIVEDIHGCLRTYGSQPVLFVGSGLSLRYLGLPLWEALLKELQENCPVIPRQYAYYKQTVGDLPEIGQIFADFFHEWAWDQGNSQFPDNMFSGNEPRDIYIKYQVSKLIRDKCSVIEKISDEYNDEIESLKSINPEAIITTNYDGLLEEILFPDYSKVIGESVIRHKDLLYGEIFKIHGCYTDPKTIVLTKNDYLNFNERKKYLSAKLLTYFTEHPVLLIGYRAGDPNVRAILSDIDEILSAQGGVIPNIYRIDFKREIDESDLIFEDVISIENGKNIRIKTILASDFKWIFDAFSLKTPLENIKPRLLRAFLARMQKLVRVDIPKTRIEVDYKMIEKIISDEDEAYDLFAIASPEIGTDLAIRYPFQFRDICRELKITQYYLNKAWPALNRIVGFDIRASDNQYHCQITNKGKYPMRRYSTKFLELLISHIKE